MDKKVLIIKHIDREAPGLIRTVLQESRILFKVMSTASNHGFPNAADYSAIFVLGGPQSANDPAMQKELEFVMEALQEEVPYFGICLGMQTLVKAAGGEVYQGNLSEVGCRDTDGKYFAVDKTRHGKMDRVFNGVSDSFKVFQLHGETVELPDNAVLLGQGSGNQVKNQFVRVGNNAYGIQGHIELIPSMLERWILKDKMFNGTDTDSINSDYTRLQAEYNNTGRAMFNNFLKIAGLLK